MRNARLRNCRRALGLDVTYSILCGWRIVGQRLVHDKPSVVLHFEITTLGIWPRRLRLRGDDGQRSGIMCFA